VLPLPLHPINSNRTIAQITRARRSGEYGTTNEVKISVVARNNEVIRQLVREAKAAYEADAVHQVHIFLGDPYGYWRFNGARQKRPLASVVLEPAVKDMLVADCKDFLRSEEVSPFFFFFSFLFVRVNLVG
jgi:chaperone BCS1